MAEWYFTQNGQSLGPVSIGELTELAEQGKLRPSDLVWKEGMPEWIPARQSMGLFPESRRARPAEDAPRRRSGDDDDLDRPRSRRRADEDDDRPRRRRRTGDDDDLDRPIRRRPKSGGGNGLALVLGIGGGVLVLIIAVVVLLVAIGGSDDVSPKNFNLQNGQETAWNVTFKARTRVEIRVASNSDSDVDLFVFNANNQLIAKDEGPSKDCYVQFDNPNRQSYKVQVVNRVLLDMPWRNKPNSGTVSFTQTSLNNAPPIAVPMPAPAPAPFPKMDQKFPNPKNNPTPPGAIPLAGKASWNGDLTQADPIDPAGVFGMRNCKVFTYPMQAGKTYVIDMKSIIFDAYLRLEDPNGNQVAFDDDSGGGLDARIVHTAAMTGTYRIVATACIKGTGAFQLTVSP